MSDQTWTFGVVFGWTGPVTPLYLLRKHGTLEQVDSGDHAWTVPVTGDPGPGTADERAGRAEWIAQEALVALLGRVAGTDESDDPARYFAHRSTTRVAGDGDE
ncbi:hypothetical protein EDD27_4536 [Nonomuraea polychroma]|uniref:Uncharacterized protein n=1 Tax=Nonomuraea polychroma TaxID=46176 RepID=A0A438M882_9ACTN|nr:hypothetical protein [Nonomuraea polychroma]RVX41930.1 hypothetical protein EDD27_4536 [Nonomuraea polychroma]